MHVADQLSILPAPLEFLVFGKQLSVALWTILITCSNSVSRAVPPSRARWTCTSNWLVIASRFKIICLIIKILQNRSRYSYQKRLTSVRRFLLAIIQSESMVRRIAQLPRSWLILLSKAANHQNILYSNEQLVQNMTGITYMYPFSEPLWRKPQTSLLILVKVITKAGL